MMWLLSCGLFLIPVASSVFATPDLRITAESGDDVILPCGAPERIKLTTLEFIRTDLEEGKYVFLYRDNRVDPDDQDESFKNRVILLDNQMKDGDLSVVLKNVTVNDNGTYECRVKRENDPQREPELISTIHLQVSPPGEENEGGAEEEAKGGDKGKLGEVMKEDVDGVSRGRFGLIGLVFPLAAVAVFWISTKIKSSSRRSNNQQKPDHELDMNSNTERNMINSNSVDLQISQI